MIGMRFSGRTFFLLFFLIGFVFTPGCSKSETGSVENALPRLVDLGATQCIPCKQMAPILDELETEYEGLFEVEFIDVWQSENRSKAEQYGIRMIPTQIFLDASGKELWRHEGFFSKEEILNKWKELGIRLNHDR